MDFQEEETLLHEAVPMTPPTVPPRFPASVSPKVPPAVLEGLLLPGAADDEDFAVAQRRRHVQRQSADDELSALSMPAAAVKRIARVAAPEVTFSSEAIAALHRIGQAFVCYATDRTLREMQADGDPKQQAGKKKGRSGPLAPRKTMGSDHVMQFLATDLPAVSTKIATLFYDLVPHDYRPEGVKLLEQFHAQERAAAEAPAAAPAGGAAEAGGAPLETLLGAVAAGTSEAAASAGAKSSTRPAGATLKRHASAEEAAPKKRAKGGPASGAPAAPTAAAAAPPSLSKLFGMQRQAAATPTVISDSAPPESAAGLLEEAEEFAAAAGGPPAGGA